MTVGKKSGKKTEDISFAGKRILLVEDHPLNVIVAKGLLEKKQFEVVTAENGRKAVELVENFPEYYFDAVLMDIRMPVLDGIGAARELRALDREDVKDLPIIAMTANAGEEDRKQTREAGMNEHLAKPIDPKLLYATLQKFILS
ncbi:response regulator [Roseburia sp. AM23-20]|uniref:response regulator n=1 Tax=Roseburia sp. AM23-20 TaxID=2292066 RepID=UPI001313E47C|nr:response regulator [Roseburia sp. AM23-20]